MSSKSTPKRTETYPNPDDTNPATLNSLNLSEAPVTVRGDDGRHELGETEGAEQRDRGTLHEEEAVRTRDEDEGLRDDGDLEVDDHVELAVVVVDGVAALEGNTELVLEERGLDDGANEGDTKR